MGAEKLETDPFIAMIEAKIAAWQAVADRYRAALALETGQSTDLAGVQAVTRVGSVRQVSNAAADIPLGAFRTMAMAQAVKVYLGAAKRRQTMKEIAAGLKKGGLVTTTDDDDRFEKSLNTTLYRLRSEKALLKFPDGWDLADAYAEPFKQRLANKDSQQRSRRLLKKKKPQRSIKVIKSESIKTRKPESSEQPNEAGALKATG